MVGSSGRGTKGYMQKSAQGCTGRNAAFFESGGVQEHLRGPCFQDEERKVVVVVVGWEKKEQSRSRKVRARLVRARHNPFPILATVSAPRQI